MHRHVYFDDLQIHLHLRHLRARSEASQRETEPMLEVVRIGAAPDITIATVMMPAMR